MTPEEVAKLADMGRVSRLNAIHVGVLLVLYGIYLCLFPCSVFVILSRPIRRSSAILLALTFIVFFATTMRALSFICYLTRQLENFYMAVDIPITDRRMRSASEFHIVRSHSAHAWTYPINLIVTDAIVAWRAWKLWEHTMIRLILAITFLSSAAMSFVFPALTVKHHFANSLDPRIDREFAVSSTLLSFGVNFLATCLIAIKAWNHRRLMTTIFKASDGTARVQKTMVLLVETGAAFCILQIVNSAVYLMTDHELTSLNIARVSVQESLFVLGAAYPSLMIIITSRKKSSMLEGALSPDAGPDSQTVPRFINDTEANETSTQDDTVSDLFYPVDSPSLDIGRRSSSTLGQFSFEKPRPVEVA